MLKFTRSLGVLAATLVALMWVAPAQAQATRTWVSGVGDDANPCSRTAPCKTFAGAISKTAVGGEIDALDPAGYGGVTITKSITLDGGGGQVASVLVSGTNGITVNGAGIVVTIKNLSMNGLGTSPTGISFVNGAKLNVVHCDIMGMTTYGIGFLPSVAGSGLFVSDTTLHGNLGYGIAIAPSITTGAPTVATLESVKIFQNGTGLLAQDNTRTDIARSNVSNNSSNGIVSNSASVAALIGIDSTMVSNNGGTALTTSGAGVPRIRMSNSSVSGNTGSSIAGAPNVASFGNNYIVDNGTDVFPGASVPQK